MEYLSIESALVSNRDSPMGPLLVVFVMNALRHSLVKCMNIGCMHASH